MRSLWSLIWLLLLTSSLRADDYALTIRSESNEFALVEITLPEGADADRSWELFESRNDPSDKGRYGRPTQPVIGDRRRLSALLTPREWNQKLLLRPVPPGRVELLPPVHLGPFVHEHDGKFTLANSPYSILSYHTATSNPPTGIASHYARSGHIHPLMTPIHQTVTAEFPADHPHQHGLFFAWVNTLFDGHKVDFWNQGGLLGNVRHKRLIDSAAGRVFSGFRAELEHIDLTAGETVVLNETWQVIAWFALTDKFSYYVVDLESRQVAATEKPLSIQKYHYGGFGWRGPDDWLLPKDGQPSKGCTFLTSLGDDRVNGNHTRPDWVAVTGEVNGNPCTVAIFGSSQNFQHPQPVRLHPDKPYFCFAPCVLGEFAISRERPLTSRYRIVTHAGPAAPGLYDRLVQQWRNPPTVTFGE